VHLGCWNMGRFWEECFPQPLNIRPETACRFANTQSSQQLSLRPRWHAVSRDKLGHIAGQVMAHQTGRVKARPSNRLSEEE
jgi:hypothetical protein